MGGVSGPWTAGRVWRLPTPHPWRLVKVAAMYFHSFTADGQLFWQGEVLGHPTPDTVKVQLFSWLTGGRTDTKVLPIADTRGWQFYLDEATWHAHSERAFR